MEARKKKKEGPLIKGYLPVRLKFPSLRPGEEASLEETFFYVKEHHKKSDNNNNNKSDTLFVANAPVVPPVPTKLLLHSLFGRYGEVSRVLVVENPRQHQVQHEESIKDEEALLAWTNKFQSPSFLPPNIINISSSEQGKFAHVVFESNKEMKQTLRALTDLMMSSSSNEDDNEDELPGLFLDRVEIQTLADNDDADLENEDNNDDDDEHNKISSTNSQSQVLAVAARYRASCAKLNRQALLEECNAVMQQYEDAEQTDRQARQAAANGTPDDDGFITVSYNQVGSNKRELEQDATPGRRTSNKRSRKKKKGIGATQLQDFYRFQTKVHRKKNLQELRERFEEDLQKVKKMKQERQYRPF